MLGMVGLFAVGMVALPLLGGGISLGLRQGRPPYKMPPWGVVLVWLPSYLMLFLYMVGFGQLLGAGVRSGMGPWLQSPAAVLLLLLLPAAAACGAALYHYVKSHAMFRYLLLLWWNIWFLAFGLLAWLIRALRM